MAPLRNLHFHTLPEASAIGKANYIRRSIIISKKSRKQRRKEKNESISQTIHVDMPPPEGWNNSRISLIKANPPVGDKKTFCPLNYHDLPDPRNAHPTESNGPPGKKVIQPLEYHNPPVNLDPLPAQAAPSAPHPPQKPENTTVTFTHNPASFLGPAKPITVEISQPCQQGFDLSKLVKENTSKVDMGMAADDTAASIAEALTPRNPAGRLLPIAVENQPQRAMIPYFSPNENGSSSPLLTEAEFTNGQTPANLSYEPGYIVSERDSKGNLEYKQFYDDPVKNLEPWQRKALDVGLQTMQKGSSKQEEKATSEEVALISHSDGFDAVIDSPKEGCLYFDSKRGRVKFTNFRVIAKESRMILGKNEGDAARIEYLVEVYCGGITMDITMAPHELDNAVRKIQTELPCCMVLPGVLKSHIYIANHIRKMLLNLPQKLHIQRTGFHRIQNAWVFAQDRAVPPNSNTVFDTGHYIPNSPGVSDAQACLDSLSWLEISHRDDLIVPMYLLSFLSIMFKLFQEAGRTVRFVTAVTGRSGSLKTSTSMACFRLYNDDDLTPKASYKDTETALEKKMGEANGAVVVIDDLHPEASGNRNENHRGKFESVLRFVGDNITKSRSNTKLGRAVEFRPSGCVLTTAEDLSGSQSAVLRCLILRIGKGDIDGKKLRRFQENPLLTTTQKYRFSVWAGKHGDEIIDMLRSNFPRSAFEGVVTELRLVDTGATLLATAQILASYAQSVGAMSQEQAKHFTQRCYNAICTAIVASEAMSKEVNPCVLHLQALFSMMERGEIRLADSIRTYSAEFHDGFLDDQCAWLDTDLIFSKVCKYYSRLNSVFPLSERQLAIHLADSQLIDIEPRQEGSNKRNYRRKSSLPNRKRMQVLHLDRAMAYLEENGNN